jgi:hypothetical protein
MGVERVAVLRRGGWVAGVWKDREVEAVIYSTCWADSRNCSSPFSQIPSLTNANNLYLIHVCPVAAAVVNAC